MYELPNIGPIQTDCGAPRVCVAKVDGEGHVRMVKAVRLMKQGVGTPGFDSSHWKKKKDVAFVVRDSLCM
jgi:hypothetical protein